MDTEQRFHNTSRGFTLIELLVVIAIIGILSSVVLASLNSARAKARDAKAKSELAQVRTALYFYLDKFGTMPTPDQNPYRGEEAGFKDIAQQLVTAGFLGSVPQAPANHAYLYYNYGAGSVPGGLLVTSLESVASTLQPYPGTCRPWSGRVNWCDTDILSTNYCLCNPY
ncbi:MAG: prepilin-type N-terminal cleavage/methylation domain-containing protein [Patescibacteria group bacterium]|nr:prepilin-type N-terminal cleavage/methylation domain-containing protein [Patescibacteria group bacterium]MDE2218687.1 prepilin-type N-terminal cleavage/methylation domain-containing protein [Patescibacteria group bacterium]